MMSQRQYDGYDVFWAMAANGDDCSKREDL